MGDAPNQPQKPESACRFSYFLFTLILCVILGAAFVVIPILTFEEKDTLKNTDFISDVQVGFKQADKFDSVVFKTTQSAETGIYIFKKGYEKKLKAINASTDFTFQSKTMEKKMNNGDSAVAEIFYMPKSFLEVQAYGEPGSSLTFEKMDSKKYNEFKEKNHVITLSPEFSDTNEIDTNFTYDDYGIHYIVLTNKGKTANVAFSVSVKTPVYKLVTDDAVKWCVNESKCKFEELPRNYFAIVNVHVNDTSKMNRISVTQIYNNTFRWTFPILIYALLVVIIICDFIIYCVCAHAAQKRGVSGYSSISDAGSINNS